MNPPRTYPHWIAVATMASVAICYGGGFATMQMALRAGLSVGAVLSLRFVLAAIAMGVLLLVRREPLARRAVLDGICLGLLLVALLWLQTDGLRFTTTSKSAFITSLYVGFTPFLTIVLGDRVLSRGRTRESWPHESSFREMASLLRRPCSPPRLPRFPRNTPE